MSAADSRSGVNSGTVLRRACLVGRRYEEALSPLQRSVSMVPGMTQVHAALAAAYAALGRDDDARAQVERIESLNPSFGRDYVRRFLPIMKRDDLDGHYEEVGQYVVAEERCAALVRWMRDVLDDRAQYVLCCRYGLGGNERQTLQQIGETLGLSRERVRQSEGKSLRKLKRVRRSVAHLFDENANDAPGVALSLNTSVR